MRDTQTCWEAADELEKVTQEREKLCAEQLEAIANRYGSEKTMTDTSKGTPEWRKVESSNVDAIANWEGSLYVRFKNGNVYKYDDHPEDEDVTASSLFLALVNADEDPGRSVGSTFNQIVRAAGVPTTKIELDED